jgi:Asp-tRNA(Asn)/Glu-tRNA(Gln) amidotransferase A subunit family amidase
VKVAFQELPGIVMADAAVLHQDRLQTQPQDFGPDVLALLRAGAAQTAIAYSQLRHQQARLRRTLELLFDDYDLLLTPTTPMAAPLYSQGGRPLPASKPLTLFTALSNLVGTPALSLPCGFTRNRLPIGLQLIGPHWSEAELLRAGFAYEQATAWHVNRPPACAAGPC